MTALTLERIDELDDTLKRCFPTTDWKKTLDTYDADTICVPYCIDVLKPNAYRGSADDATLPDRQNITGTLAEAEFLNRFAELKLGGILIICLRTTDLEKTGRQQKGQNVLADGDWDAIFIHRKRGIFVVEVKGAGQDVLGELQMTKAKAQLDKLINNVRLLYLKFFNLDFPSVTGIICFPFRQWIMSSEDKMYHGYDVIDSTVIHSPQKLKRLFEPRAELSIVEDDLIEIFAAELICCRSEVMFHSQAYNAMQVAEWVETQDYQSKVYKKQGGNDGKVSKKKGKTNVRELGRIILTAEQLNIVNCSDHCITIRGTPGSGKTLIIMNRALNAARELKAGRVLVFVNEALMPKYEKYFFEANQQVWFARDPIVLSTDRMTEAQSNDDIFFDETPIVAPVIRELKKRALAAGKTTVVFTGFDKPGRADTEFRLYESELAGYSKHFVMNTVLRGTKEIFNEWQKYFHRGTKIGHSIVGTAVDRRLLDGIESAQRVLLDKILVLLKEPPRSNSEAAESMRLTSAHLAVITSHKEDAENLSRFFTVNKIATGSIKEQVNDSKPIMAVDTYDRTPSYEWPIVFVVHRQRDPKITKEAVFSMAASRCIASLTIIEFDDISSRKANAYPNPEVNELYYGRADHLEGLESFGGVNGLKAKFEGLKVQSAAIAKEAVYKPQATNASTAYTSPLVPPSKSNILQQPLPQQNYLQRAGLKKQKTWIRLQIGNSTIASAELFFENFVSEANAAGHNLKEDCVLFWEVASVQEVTYLNNVSGISTVDYIIALDFSGYTKKVQDRACNVLIKIFPNRPLPYTVFHSTAKKCLPYSGFQDYDANMRSLVQKVFRHFESKNSN
uniref:Uncharacterized protein n=1 Tax=Plectus sambesii TaxID=2011161 RepID=A0A914WH31_9BILA